MVSDICSDASDQIAEWQRDCPKGYASLAVEIGNVRRVLDGLRLYLDMLPTDDLREPLRRALADLDVSAVIAASDAVVSRSPVNFAQHDPSQPAG